MFSLLTALAKFVPGRDKSSSAEFVPGRDKSSGAEFVPGRDKSSGFGFAGAQSATSLFGLGGSVRATSVTVSPRNTLYLLFLTRLLCKAISAPFKGPLNPFPFRDKVFTCHSRFRLLLPQKLTIDETYGWNYV